MADLNDDIARYLSGRMSPAEMHALEKRALDDPFIADAIDGGDSIAGSAFSDDVSQLHQLINERARATGALSGTTSGTGKQISMWNWPARIAAGLLLVAGAGVIFYFISDNPGDQLALNTITENEAPTPSLRKPATDSVSAHVDRSGDAAGDAAVGPGQPSTIESSPDATSPTPAPTEEQARREPGNITPSGDSVRPRKSAINPDADNRAKNDPGNRAKNDPSKDDADQKPAVNPVDGYVAGVQKYAAKPKAESATGRPTDVASEAEVLDRVTSRNAAQDTTRAGSANALAQRQADDQRADDAKADQAAGATAKKERKALPSAAMAAEESTDGKQSLSTKQVFSGKVVDADGTGIPGVNVVIKGTNTGTVTDIHGNYQLSVPDAKPTLVFSFIGYANLEQEADAAAPATVALQEDLTQLSEVVVAGYGAQRTDEPNPTFDFANPAGGRRAFKQYLEKNLQYPREALLNNVEGRVTIQFSVSTTGSLSDFKILKGIGSGCDQEVIRLIKSGPKWNPTRRDEVAEKSTIKVRMRFQLPREKKR